MIVYVFVVYFVGMVMLMCGNLFVFLKKLLSVWLIINLVFLIYWDNVCMNFLYVNFIG